MKGKRVGVGLREGKGLKDRRGKVGREEGYRRVIKWITIGLKML